MGAGDIKLRVHLDTEQAKTERDQFVQGFSGAVGSAMSGAFRRFGGGGYLASLPSRVHEAYLGSLSDPLRGIGALAGERTARWTGLEGINTGMRAFTSGREQVADALGIAAVGMAPDQIRKFAGPILDMGLQLEKGRSSVFGALSGGETLGPMIGMEGGTVEQMLRLAQTAGELKTVIDEVIGALRPLAGIFK